MSPLARSAGLRAVLVGAALFCCSLAVFGAAVALDRALVGAHRPDLLALLLGAVVVAVSMTRLRRGAERLVNRLAFGESADTYEMVAGFVGKMASTLALDDVLPRLAETAARSAHASHGEVSLWLADGRQWRQSWPPRAPDAPAPGGTLSVQVEHRGDAVGEIGVGADGEGVAGAGRRALDELAAPAGLALSTVRLTVELRRRVDELVALAGALEASKARLVGARRLEQARILAAVRSSVVPHLDEAAAILDALADPHAAGRAERFARARAVTLAALESLRGLARGVFPALLADAGLEAALTGWSELGGRRLELRTSGPLELLREHPAAEAALYGCVVASLGRAPRPGEHVEIALEALLVQVRVALDPGREPAGAALESARDRVEALGGTVELAPGESGAMLVATIPLGPAAAGPPGASQPARGARR